MFCFNCGKNLPEGSKFCFYCGNEQPEYVPFAALKKAAPAPIIQPEYTAPEPVVQPEPVIIPEPIVEEPAPVVIPEPIVEEPAPVVIPEPVVTPAPVAEAPAPVVAPVVEEPVPAVTFEPAPAYPAPTPVVEPEAEPKKKKEKKQKKEKKASEKSGRGGVIVLIVLCAILAILTVIVGIGYAQRIRANKPAMDMPVAEAPATLEAAPEAVAEPETAAPILALPAPDYFFGIADIDHADVNARDFSWFIDGDPTVYPHIYLEFVCGGYDMEVFEERENGDGMEYVIGADDMVYATFGWRESKPEIYFHYEDFVPLEPSDVSLEFPAILAEDAGQILPRLHEPTNFMNGVEQEAPPFEATSTYAFAYIPGGEDAYARAMGYAQLLADDPSMPFTLNYQEQWTIPGSTLDVFAYQAKDGFDFPEAGFVIPQGEESDILPGGAVVVIVESRDDGTVILHVTFSDALEFADMGQKFDPDLENPYMP